MNPRSPERIKADIDALGRPTFDAFKAFRRGGKPDPALAAWRATHPDGDARYTALLAELEAAERWGATQAYLGRQRRAWEAASGLGKATLDIIEAPRDTDAMRAVRSWRAGEALWCLLLGGPGTGKTCAAAWAMREASSLGESALLVPATKLTRLATFEGEGETLAHVSWLAIDDMGAHHTSAWQAATWHEVLAERHERGLRTCLTANLAADALKAALGPRLTDRVRSSCAVYRLQGGSMRGAP